MVWVPKLMQEQVSYWGESKSRAVGSFVVWDRSKLQNFMLDAVEVRRNYVSDEVVKEPEISKRILRGSKKQGSKRKSSKRKKGGCLYLTMICCMAA